MPTLVETKRKASRQDNVTVWGILVGLPLLVSAFVVGMAFLQSSNSEGWYEGYFAQTVKVAPVRSDASWLFPSATTRSVNVTVLRTGQYVVYPKATYDVTLSVSGSVAPPQHFVVKSGEVDTTFPLEVKWQWTPGSLADREQLAPQFVTVAIKRRADGAVESHTICFCGKVGLW